MRRCLKMKVNVKSQTFIVLLNAIDQLQIQNVDGQMLLNWFLFMKSETASFFLSFHNVSLRTDYGQNQYKDSQTFSSFI